MLEKNIQKKCIKLAEALGYHVMKLCDERRVGAPDALLINPVGHHIYVEFKRPGGKVRAVQKEYHILLRNRGCELYVIDSLEEFVKKIASRKVDR